ncbi:nuclear pore complex component-domain-containing protein [Phyllosticta citriasiana]|uniref:Nuclear pore complex component-domain-containing protein n=1 Tax=Phyllosticta citriasiana TaxID=595635 RepID=A0ABR1KBV1_9PEZI
MSTPITPSSSTPGQANTATPTGTWRHPRFEEINRRKNATKFGETEAKALLANLAVLFMTFIVPRLTPRMIHDACVGLLSPLPASPANVLLLIRLAFFVNAGLTLAPLFRKPDDLADIPLTPQQRALLGLDPNVASAPGTPNSGVYITPPRYQRSSTPRGSDRRSGSRSRPASGSPLSGSPRGGYSSGVRDSSPYNYSPSGGSPLWQKAVAGDRRQTWNESQQSSSSTLAASGRELYETLGRERENTSSVPGTPTPLGAGKSPSVSLTNRWLYEKSRRSEGLTSPRSSIYA